MPKLNELLSLYSLNREVSSIGKPGSSDFTITLDNGVTITIDYPTSASSLRVLPPVEDYVEVAEFSYPDNTLPHYRCSRRVIVDGNGITFRHLFGYDLDRKAPRRFLRSRITNLRFVSVHKRDVA